MQSLEVTVDYLISRPSAPPCPAGLVLVMCFWKIDMFFSSNHHFVTPNLQILMCFWKTVVHESCGPVLGHGFAISFDTLKKIDFSSGHEFENHMVPYYLEISSKIKDFEGFR